MAPDPVHQLIDPESSTPVVLENPVYEKSNVGKAAGAGPAYDLLGGNVNVIGPEELSEASSPTNDVEPSPVPAIR